MEINDILSIAVRHNASDIHLKAGLPPVYRVNGALVPLKDAARLAPEEISQMLLPLMSNSQRERFRDACEVDLAYGVQGVGRFRVNVFQQRGVVGAVFRVIPLKIATIAELGLPKVVEQIAMEQRGLILVTGTTGAGKSTTLAAMVDHINSNRTAHLLTIEDPIEFLIRDKRSIVNQREVGVDTGGFAPALRAALRQDPDVILVGEMRDVETIEIALTAAETGHLVMSTLHTLDAAETVGRIVSAFPPHHQRSVRLQLASVLRAIIGQRLVPRADGAGRVPAIEILRMTSYVRELIEDPERTKEMPAAIAKGNTTLGMQTFDQSLMGLLQRQVITYEEALRQASNPDDFALHVSGISGTSDARWQSFEEPAPTTAAGPTGGGIPLDIEPVRPRTPATAVPARRGPTPTPPAATPGGRAGTTPAAPTAVPKASTAAGSASAADGGADDDLIIERF